jgi:hypothetical protein
MVTGCAMSSGVLKMGPDTYTLSVAAAPARGGVVGAKQLALTQASDYCTAAGREIVVTNISGQSTTRMGAGNVDVTFQCLLAGDRDLRRPEYQPPPTTIIQDQRQR